MNVLGVDNVLLAAGGFEEARAFYVDRLGLTLRFAVPEAGLLLFALGAEDPGLLVRAEGAEPGPPKSSPRLWLEVPDAREAAVQLRGQGVEPLAEPFEVHTGWTVEIADPWGNVVGFTDYTKAPERGRRPNSS